MTRTRLVSGLALRVLAAALLATAVYFLGWHPAPMPIQKAVFAVNVPVATLTFVVPEALHGVDDYLNPACRGKCLGIAPDVWGTYFWLHLGLAVPVYTALLYIPLGVATLSRRLRRFRNARA